MVEEELHAINEVKDASMRLKEFNKVKFTKGLKEFRTCPRNRV
jgi:hypothetical protein